MGRSRLLLLLLALMAGLGTAACERGPRQPPPQVIDLGLRTDSAAGAMIVGAGDTVWSIAQRYRLPVRHIIDLNDIDPPYALRQGQRLKLPPPLDYRVRGGDTVYSIANTFGVSVSQLVEINRLQPPYAPASGQILRIPSAAPARTSFVKKMTPHRLPANDRNSAARTEEEEVHLPEKRPALSRRPAPLTAPRERPDQDPPAVILTESRNPHFVWPVRGKVISGYGPKAGGLFNDGINIAAPRGTPVAAAADGIVAYVGSDLKSYGNLVLVRHGGGRITAYAHLASARVERGAAVHRGQTIGVVGSSGAVSASQLHFEIRQGSKAYDPAKYLTRPPA